MINFESNLNQILRQLDIAKNRSLIAIAALGKSMSKVYCAVDTGRLRGSIDDSVEDNHVDIGTNVEYAPYVHELHKTKSKFIEKGCEGHIDQMEALSNNIFAEVLGGD